MSIDKLIEFKNGELSQGLGIDSAKTDKHLVYKPNRFTCIVGRPNIGKTFVILWYFLCLSKKHGIKWDIYSIENEIWVLKMYLIEFLAGGSVKDTPEKDIFDFNNWIDEHFNFIRQDTMTLEEVLKEAKNGNVFIDPYNALNKPSGNSHEYDYHCIRLIQEYKRTKGSVYINHHPFTEAQRRVIRDKESEFDGYPDYMRYYDVEGGGKWFNACDSWISLHRFVNHPQRWQYTRMMIEKEKVTQTGGSVTEHQDYILAEYKNNRFFINNFDPLSDKKELDFDSAEEIDF